MFFNHHVELPTDFFYSPEEFFPCSQLFTAFNKTHTRSFARHILSRDERVNLAHDIVDLPAEFFVDLQDLIDILGIIERYIQRIQYISQGVSNQDHGGADILTKTRTVIKFHSNSPIRLNPEYAEYQYFYQDEIQSAFMYLFFACKFSVLCYLTAKSLR